MLGKSVITPEGRTITATLCQHEAEERLPYEPVTGLLATLEGNGLTLVLEVKPELKKPEVYQDGDVYKISMSRNHYDELMLLRKVDLDTGNGLSAFIEYRQRKGNTGREEKD